MKQIFFLFGLLFCSGQLAAQHGTDKPLPEIAPYRNAFYLEAGGNGGGGG